MNIIFKLIPGLQMFRTYKAEWFTKDLAAGLTVASIALPVGIAYSALADFPPEIGLYSTILPMLAFALFGSSKKLIIGPDAATLMMIVSALVPFVALGAEVRHEACVVLSLLVGLLCIIGGIFRLGFIADFLSKPILTGYLNGLTFTIIISQITKVFGYKTIDGGFLKVLVNFLSRLSETNITTFIFGMSVILFLLICKKVSRKIPAALIASVGGGVVVYFLGLQNYGVAVIGNIPGGLPSLNIPQINVSEISALMPAALSIFLMSYCSGMLTDKSFASKTGDEVNANREFFGFGAADIASGISGGFVVSGADSKTAVAISLGSKTQLTSIIAAVTLSLILLFFTSPLAYLPTAALGAIVIVSAMGFFDTTYLKKLYRINKKEFLLSVFTSLAVMTIGVLEGVIIAVALAVLLLIARAAKPADTLIGRAPNSDTYQDIDLLETREPTPGIIIYRFESALVFFNADYFKRRIKELISNSKDKPKLLLLDAGSINHLDSTGNDALEELINELEIMGIKISIVRTQKQFQNMIEKSGIAEKIGKENFYPTIKTGVEAYQKNKK
ncbi:MAG: SulP family inorganic anion transporter [Ignavibacteria bacterium]